MWLYEEDVIQVALHVVPAVSQALPEILQRPAFPSRKFRAVRTVKQVQAVQIAKRGQSSMKHREIAVQPFKELQGKMNRRASAEKYKPQAEQVNPQKCR